MITRTLILLSNTKNIYSSMLFKDGSSALSHSIDILKSLKEKFDAQYFVSIKNNVDISTQTAQQQVKQVPMQVQQAPSNFIYLEIDNTINALLETLFSIHTQVKSKDTKAHFFVVWTDCLFHYAPLYNNIFDLHIKYFAHYTFAEGYPTGISAELLSDTAIEMMYTLLKSNQKTADLGDFAIDKESIFSVIKTKINDFDIETALAPEDMRKYRVSLTCNSRRNFVICKQLYEQGLRNPDEIPTYYQKYPQYFRGAPSFVYMQLTNKRYDTFIKPLSVVQDLDINNQALQYISVDNFTSFTKKIAEFSPEAVLCLGYNGEVAVHPHIGTLLKIATQYFETIYLETNGRDWHEHMDEKWWKEQWVTQIKWIVSIDAYKEETYELIHKSSIQPLRDFLNFLQDTVPSSQIYPQTVRIPENENELEHFIAHWESLKVTPIIQKYNSFSATLPDRRVVNVSPLHRFACHHLARDLVISLTGKVMMCEQATSNNHIIADLTNMTLEQVWAANEQNFIAHVNKKYNGICKFCDEYYIVNV